MVSKITQGNNIKFILIGDSTYNKAADYDALIESMKDSDKGAAVKPLHNMARFTIQMDRLMV